MSNNLTNLAPVLYSAAQTVAREPHGAINSITNNFSSKPCAQGDTIKVPVVPAKSAADFPPAPYTPQGGDATAQTISVTVNKNRQVSWYLTGEQMQSLNNADVNTEWVRQSVEQAMRTLVNEFEADVCNAAYKGASRGYGTVGTTPFASDLSALVEARKILADNGAPFADVSLITTTSAAALYSATGLPLPTPASRPLILSPASSRLWLPFAMAGMTSSASTMPIPPPLS